LFDSYEARALFGKNNEQIKMHKLIKEKLRATSIPNLKLIDQNGDVTLFSDLFTFESFLGTGSFGFVVSATDKENGEKIAIKIVETS
jgi:uncharacterized protein YrzB (UPF0473 family)